MVPVTPLKGVNELMTGPVRINPDVAIPNLLLPDTCCSISNYCSDACHQSTVNDDAATPPKSTAVTLVKFEPLIFTWVFVIPDAGVNEFIVGTGRIVIAFFKIEIVYTLELADTISGFELCQDQQ